MQVTATEAKNRFGYYLSQVEREPVQVLKNDRVAAVMISAARYAQLEALEQRGSIEARRQAFRAQYGDWIEAQNAHVEAQGLWCDGLVPWQQEPR